MIRLIDRQLLDEVSREAGQSPRRRMNLNFHTTDDFPAHRLLNAIEPGSYVAPHRHLDSTKDETILVLQGSLGLVTFDDQGLVIFHCRLDAGSDCVGVDIPHGTWHTLIALVPGTVMFEAKAGPFVPLDPAEKASWAPMEGSESVPAYLTRLTQLFD
jgi:cupin fold WbuC family metalloprotein